MSNGAIDETARQRIDDHIDACGERYATIQEAFADLRDSFRRVHTRLDRLLYMAISLLGLALLGLLTFVADKVLP